jgi:hypothetical protein
MHRKMIFVLRVYFAAWKELPFFTYPRISPKSHSPACGQPITVILVQALTQSSSSTTRGCKIQNHGENEFPAPTPIQLRCPKQLSGKIGGKQYCDREPFVERDNNGTCRGSLLWAISRR